MRQPVCVGCDGRELLTLNSVTAPLTESHLNAHKRSGKYLRNTRSCGAGVKRGNPAKAEGPNRGKHPPNGEMWTTCWAKRVPRLVPRQPRSPSSRTTSAPSEGTRTASDSWLSNGFIGFKTECKSLCKIIVFMFASSKRTADPGMVPCIQHSHVPRSGRVCKRTPGPCAASGYRLLQTIPCLPTIWVISVTEQDLLSK